MDSGDGDFRLSDAQMSLEDKMSMLQERSNETSAFLDTLVELKSKLTNKKLTIKDIIEKKIEDNLREVNKWKSLLFTVVDECLDEKIDRLTSQETFLRTTHKEMTKVLDSKPPNSDEEEEEDEDTQPQLEDLLALDLKLEPNVLSQAETRESDSLVKRDFNTLLAEPKKSLRRTFAYVAGIIRGYLRRGKSNINWIKVMRKLEGREQEDLSFDFDHEFSQFIGSKCVFEKEEESYHAESLKESYAAVSDLYEKRNDLETRDACCKELNNIYTKHPEEIEFYLPQLCNMLLQHNDFKAFKDFLISKSKENFHFALRAYLLIRANKDSRKPPQKKKLIPKSLIKWRMLCDAIMEEIRSVVTLPFQAEDDTSAEEFFNYCIHFMENLTKISKDLAELKAPEKYSGELLARLSNTNTFLQNLQKENPQAFIYIPMLKASGSPEFHKVVGIPAQEAYPIPTYGRVLYYLWLEVIDVETAEQPKKKRSNSKRVTEVSTEEGATASADRKKEKKEKKKKRREKAEDDSPSDASSSRSTSPKKTPAPPLPPVTPKKESRTAVPIPKEQSTAFGELVGHKSKRIRKTSPFGDQPTWRMQALIVKHGDEILQEEFAMQLIVEFQRIFLEADVPAKLCPYRILTVTSNSGFIEPIPNSLSLDKLKKKHTNLLNFFVQTFDQPSEATFKRAQQNFVRTMAGYSVVSYILQIKDRHDGNLLLDAHGHLIHIDYGYLLSNTIPFEKAPFKLTPEFIEVMGGFDSSCYRQYCRLCVKAFLAARQHYKKIMMLVEMTMSKKVLPCFKGGQKVLQELHGRFHLEMTDIECKKFMFELIDEARGSWRTIVYNAYQLILNNIS